MMVIMGSVSRVGYTEAGGLFQDSVIPGRKYLVGGRFSLFLRCLVLFYASFASGVDVEEQTPLGQFRTCWNCKAQDDE